MLTRIMDNRDQVKKLSDQTEQLHQTAIQTFPNSYLAYAFYIASNHHKDNVYAILHNAKNKDDFQRTDKLIHLRLLSPHASAAAKYFNETDITIMTSRYIPNEHTCVNIPIKQKAKTHGLLQLVFDSESQIPTEDQIQNSLKQIDSAQLQNIAANIEDSQFQPKPPYAVNAIMTFIDISHFTQTSSQIGAYRAQSFADKFCNILVTDTATKYDTIPFRYEGDGIWLETPIRNGNINQAFDKAKDIAHNVIKNFQDFAKVHDPAFKDAKLKAIIEIGEISADISNTANRSTPAISHMRHAEKHIARRDQHDILYGPELRSLCLGKPVTQKIAALDFQR